MWKFFSVVVALTVMGLEAHGQAALPRAARDVEGTYVLWSGFAVTRYEFKSGGKLVIGAAYDHPGGRTWIGNWSFEEGAVRVAIPYLSGGQRRLAPALFVPVAWGDRLLLLNAEELFEGDLPRLMRRVGSPVPGTSRRFGDQKTDLRVLTRSPSAEAPLARIFGKPRAPSPYDRLLDGPRW